MKADTVFFNGRCHTLDPEPPFTSAIALRGRHILAIGDDADMRALLASDGEAINLRGGSLTPGLVDAHVHFRWFAHNLQQLDIFELTSKAETLRRIASRAAELPNGRWLTGRGWKNQLWQDDSRFPTAADLDTITLHHPVLLQDKSGHAAWANTLALKLAGLGARTPDPDGGEIGRSEDGQPNGMLYETAIKLVSQHIPSLTQAEIVASMRTAQQRCWELGLTGLHDFDGANCFRALQTLHRERALGLRIVKNIPAALLEHAVGVGLQSDFGDNWLRIGGIKIFADGALGAKTALMVEPYADDPDNRGIAVTDKEEMAAIASQAAANRLSVTVHAIGDQAVHDVLDVYTAVREEEQNQHPHHPRLRHRIEHVQVYHPDDRNRLAELGVIASMQPTHATSDMEIADRYWGARARTSYAWRDMLKSGALLVFGSDAPIEPINPLFGLHAAVTRRQRNGRYAPEGWYPEQRLTLTEALHAFTLAAAQTSGQADRLGSLTPGKLADLTIFDRDLTQLAGDTLLQAQVVGTVVDGKFRFRAM